MHFIKSAWISGIPTVGKLSYNSSSRSPKSSPNYWQQAAGLQSYAMWGVWGRRKELLLSYQTSLVHAKNVLQALLRAKEESSLAVISKRKSRLSS